MDVYQISVDNLIPSLDTSDIFRHNKRRDKVYESLFKGDFLQAVPSKLFHLACALDTWKADDPWMHRHGWLKMRMHSWTCSQGLTNGFKKTNIFRQTLTWLCRPSWCFCFERHHLMILWNRNPHRIELSKTTGWSIEGFICCVKSNLLSCTVISHFCSKSTWDHHCFGFLYGFGGSKSRDIRWWGPIQTQVYSWVYGDESQSECQQRRSSLSQDPRASCRHSSNLLRRSPASIFAWRQDAIFARASSRTSTHLLSSSLRCLVQVHLPLLERFIHASKTTCDPNWYLWTWLDASQ